MAAYPELTKADLGAFAGVPAVAYKPFAETSAIPQAILLFKIGTCLAQLPDDEQAQQLARFAILAMADHISLAQKYRQANASPFSSESIGSYSYGKTAQKVQQGEKTGVMWFDLAVEQMSVCDTNSAVPMSGGIEIFNNDAYFAQGSGGRGYTRILTPAEIEASIGYGHDPSWG